MNRAAFDAVCGRLPATTHVVQWGGASVWKVGGKIFAICSVWGKGEGERISFKCGDLSYRVLSQQDGIAPAPYLARAKWVQLQSDEAMTDADIEAYIAEAHRLIASKLTKAKRRELGLG